MARKTTSANIIVPATIQTYGIPVNGWPQVRYDMYAFANRFPPDKGCPPRPELFQRIADVLLPGYFEWHSWCLAMVDALCHNSLIGITGCSNCVSGATRILDPITGNQPTIKYLCDEGIAPMVMTLEGPRRASVPFIKGVDRLYEIELANGKKFTATGKHRVLVNTSNATGGDWSFVSDLQISQCLLSYEPIHPESISELVPSIHGQDALCSLKKVEDFQSDYFPYFHHGDEQLLSDQDTFRLPSPSQADVLEHIQDGSYLDGLGYEQKHNPYHQYVSHPSTLDVYLLKSSLENGDLPRFFSERPGRICPLFQQLCQFRSELPHQPTFSERVRGYEHTHYSTCFRKFASVLSPYGYQVVLIPIVAIRDAGCNTFYDLSVPGPEHYFAEGTIHHNSSKTYHFSGMSVVWWLCDPWRSSVMYVSTSVKMLRRRAWANISKAYSMMGDNRFGNFVDSRIMWQIEVGNDLHVLCGKAVEEGSVTKAADDIKGVHTIRQMIVLDEGTAIPPAIWDAVSNLWSYPSEFILCCMGNIRNRLDAFGRWCEPKDGWTSVTPDHEEWEGKPQNEYGGRVPFILHFDAEKSPNIVEGHLISRHLPQKDRVEAAKRSAANSPLYWSNMRGFPPPEGLTKTVFTETSLFQHDAFGTLQFGDAQPQVIAMLDPAFGGNDRAIVTFALMGLMANGQWGIQALPPRQINLDVTRKETIHYQLADSILSMCERFEIGGKFYSCPITNLGVDATGEGGGLCSIIERKSGRHIVWVEFGAAASEDSVNLEDGRPANEVYRNKRAEIHFRCRDAVQSGQFKGFSREAALELCTLRFDDDKQKIVMQAKKDYKTEFHRSPDYGDSLVGLSEVARLRGFRLAAVDQTVNRFKEFEEQHQDCAAVYADTYAPEEMNYPSYEPSY